MFLGVSGSVRGMEMNDEQRRSFASLARWMRRSRFGDSKKAAYDAAGVNSATWERLEQGLPVKPLTLAKVVRNLLNEPDWTNLISPSNPDAFLVGSELIVGGDPQDAGRGTEDHVNAPGDTVEAGITNEDLLREIVRSRAEFDQIRAEVRDDIQSLSDRVARLEQRGS